jgi:F-type H+-transporting ATPase subunit a
VVAWLHHWENLVFALLVVAGLCAVAWRYARKPSLIPRDAQNLLELFVEGLDRFLHGMMGPSGRRHLPFIGTLFLYIWCMNLTSLLPGMKPPTSSLNTTVGLAFVVFCYVQAVRVKDLGWRQYLDHMAGSPRFDDVKQASVAMKPLLLLIKLFVIVVLFVLELLGEFVKPISLSLRLGFNIFAEDVLLAVLVGLGLAAGAALHSPIGLPLQFFAVPLVLIFSTVQALVFTLLTTVYISLIAPHDAHVPHETHHEAA